MFNGAQIQLTSTFGSGESNNNALIEAMKF